MVSFLPIFARESLMFFVTMLVVFLSVLCYTSCMGFEGEQFQGDAVLLFFFERLMDFHGKELLRMKELFDKIMSIDQQANERVQEAMEKKERIGGQLEQQKKQLEEQMKIAAKEHLERAQQAQQKEIEEEKRQIDQKAAAEQERLQQVYEAHREEWVAALTAGILKTGTAE